MNPDKQSETLHESTFFFFSALFFMNFCAVFIVNQKGLELEIINILKLTLKPRALGRFVFYYLEQTTK